MRAWNRCDMTVLEAIAMLQSPDTRLDALRYLDAQQDLSIDALKTIDRALLVVRSANLGNLPIDEQLLMARLRARYLLNR